MVLQVSSDLQRQVEALVATGHYRDAEDVLESALQLLRDQESLRELRASIAEAQAEYEAGNAAEFTPELMDQLYKDATSRLDELRAQLRIAEESLDRGEGIEFSPEMMDRIYESAMRRAEAGEEPSPDVCP